MSTHTGQDGWTIDDCRNCGVAIWLEDGEWLGINGDVECFGVSA